MAWSLRFVVPPTPCWGSGRGERSPDRRGAAASAPRGVSTARTLGRWAAPAGGGAARRWTEPWDAIVLAARRGEPGRRATHADARRRDATLARNAVAAVVLIRLPLFSASVFGRPLEFLRQEVSRRSTYARVWDSASRARACTRAYLYRACVREKNLVRTRVSRSSRFATLSLSLSRSLALSLARCLFHPSLSLIPTPSPSTHLPPIVFYASFPSRPALLCYANTRGFGLERKRGMSGQVEQRREG